MQTTNKEYITKQQAIDLAESLRNIAGDTITNAFVKGIEGLEGCRLLKHKELVNGKSMAIESPSPKVRTNAWIERDPYTLQKLKKIQFIIDRTYTKEQIEVALREAMQCVFGVEE